MKRFLAWCVLALVSLVFYYLEYWFFTLVFLLGNAIYRFSESLFWVLIVCEGFTALGLALLLTISANRAAVACSQLIWRSKGGLRYKVTGAILFIVNLILFVAMLAVKSLGVLNKLQYALAILTMVAFGLAMFLRGFTVVSDYGQPPTKREVLEEKIRKLDEKENHKAEATHGQDA